jgi:hypothetical protein
VVFDAQSGDRSLLLTMIGGCSNPDPSEWTKVMFVIEIFVRSELFLRRGIQNFHPPKQRLNRLNDLPRVDR